MSERVRPVPQVDIDDAPMWGHVADGALRLQRCTSCGYVRFPPGPVCPACLSPDTTWDQMAGRGRVLSWVVFRRQYFAGMEPPYAVVAGQLEEGPILLADLVDDDLDGIGLDAPLELVVEPATFEDGSTRPLYRWHRSRGARPSTKGGTGGTEERG